MSLIIDLIIVIIAVLCIFLGYKRGLTKCVIKILSFVIALVVAFVLFKPVGNWVIKNTTFDDNIRNSITQVVERDVDEKGEVKEDTGLPKSMVEHINEEIKTSANKTKETVVTTIADEISVMAVYAVVGIALFIIARLMLVIVSVLTSFLTDLPIIKQVDKLGGVIYGILETLVIVFVVFAIISFISPVMENSGLIEAINKSIIGSALYNNNILMNIIL